jgi:hypothetical protein
VKPADPTLRRGRRTRGPTRAPLTPEQADQQAEALLQGPGLLAYSYAAGVVEALSLLPVMTAGQLERLCGVSWRTLQNYAGELGLLEHIPLLLPGVDALGLEGSRTAARLYRLGAVGRPAARRLGWEMAPQPESLQPGRLALDLVLAELLLRVSAQARQAGWEVEWLDHPGGVLCRLQKDGQQRAYAVAACEDQPEPPAPTEAAGGWLLCCRAPTRPFSLAAESPTPLQALTLAELLAPSAARPGREDGAPDQAGASPDQDGASPARWLDLQTGKRSALFGEPTLSGSETIPAGATRASAVTPTEPRRSEARLVELVENQRLSGNLREVVNLPERYRRFFNYTRGAVVFTFSADLAVPPRIEFLPASDPLLAGPPERRRGLQTCLTVCDPRIQVVVWFVHPANGRQRAGLVHRETFLSRFEPVEEL